MSLQPPSPPNLHAGGDKYDLKRMLTLEEAEESVREWGQHLYSNFPSAVIELVQTDQEEQVTGGEWPPGRSRAAHGLYSAFKELIKQPDYGEMNIDKIRSNYELARSLVTPIYRLPEEIFIQIMLLGYEMVPYNHYSYYTLLAVCRQWNNWLCRIPTIWCAIYLRMWTDSEYVQTFLTRSKDRPINVFIEISDLLTISPEDIEPYKALGMTAESADRLKELTIYRDREQDIRVSRFLSPNIANYLSKIFNTAKRLTMLSLHEARSAACLLLQPNHSAIWRGLRLLNIEFNTVYDGPSLDILPHLSIIETLYLSWVPLPEYDLSTPLPLVQTLLTLHITGVSIQWMAGREFTNLQRCYIWYPLNNHAVLTKPTILPVCYKLCYFARSLANVKGFVAPYIQRISLKTRCLRVQDVIEIMLLADLPIRRESLTCLSLRVGRPTQDLSSTLEMLPALSKLQIRLAHPQTLGWKFFFAFIMGPCKGMVNGKHCKDWWCMVLRCISEEHRAAICPGLKRLNIRYERWLRSTETDRVMPIFWAIVHSRRVANNPLEELQVIDVINRKFLGGYFSLDESDWPNLPCEAAWKALENSVQHHTIQLKNVDDRVPHFLAHYPFSPFLALITRLTISINQPKTFIEPHDILQYCKRLVILELEGITLPFYSEDTDLPLVHTLRKMTLVHTSIGWMSGRTFPALKECRVLLADHDPRDELRMTHFPVCAVLEYMNRPELLNLLAKFRVPHLRSLVVGSFALESPWYPPGESRAIHSWSLRFKFPSWWGALTDELESISSLKVIGSQLVGPDRTTKRGLEMYTLVGMDPSYADEGTE